MRVCDLSTPALLVSRPELAANIARMGEAWPGPSLRPHVKAFKSTGLARELVRAGHQNFCGATAREVLGLAAAGLGTDLLLANQLLDPRRLGQLASLVRDGEARVTVAVDSTETIQAARAAGIREVLIDVNVGLPRCGCPAQDAGRVAGQARAAGLEVRGIMGYEGHVVGVEDRSVRSAEAEEVSAVLATAHQAVGGQVVSGGGTGTWDLNSTVTELQAGSFTLMDTAYGRLGMPFRPALAVLGTVLSTNRSKGWAVADVGLKALGMDHGLSAIRDRTVWFCSDEHLTFGPSPDRPSDPLPEVGSRLLVWPAHVDPTVSQHEWLHVVDGDLEHPDGSAVLDARVTESWPVDLRCW